MQKICTVEHDSGFEVQLEFKQDKETKVILYEMNNFWIGADERLQDAKGCIYTTVSKLIAIEILRLQCWSGFYSNENIVIDKFNEGIEGFYPIDGSVGIKLIYTDSVELERLDFDISAKDA